MYSYGSIEFSTLRLAVTVNDYTNTSRIETLASYAAAALAALSSVFDARLANTIATV
jgi:hypothetical protein